MVKRKVSTRMFIAVVLTIIFVYVFYINFIREDIIELKMYLTIANYTGFNVTADAIHFGAIIPGGTGTREITIMTNKSSKVMIQGYGELAKWIRASDNNFIIKANEEKSINVTVFVPADARFGNYSGTLRIVLQNIE